MLAVILAGGEGTRLRPLTLTRPKPIVPLLNVPFLHYQLAWLRRHGIREAVLACSYGVEAIRRVMGDGSAAAMSLTEVASKPRSTNVRAAVLQIWRRRGFRSDAGTRRGLNATAV